MKRARCIAIVLSILIVSLISVSFTFAQTEYVVFGPKQYDKPKGKPVTYTETFQAYMGINYTLWVQSGQDGLNEVKNVSVSINGIEVLDSSDLRKSNPSTKAISLQSNNTLKVVLKGQGGNFIKVKMLSPPLNIISISPASGETILKPEITVTCRVINFTGNETGVTVNGKVANIYGNQFVANNVSLAEGANTITVVAKDTANNTATASVTVNAVRGSYIKLSSNIESGIASLTANFSASTSNFAPASYQLDYEGDGVVDYTGTTFENISHVYSSEGIFYPTITVTDNQGNTYLDTIAIAVMNKTEIDTLLKGNWEGMKGELSQEDVDKAIKFFEENSQDTYKTQFTALKSVLNIIANDMGQISLVKIEDDRAEYEIITTRDGVTYSYHLLFVRDKDGLWKIKRF
jgi:PKD repeat protein